MAISSAKPEQGSSSPAEPAKIEPSRGEFVSVAPSDLPRPLGRYALLRRIARGGMGEVFLASTTGLEGAERPVVVKIIRREHASDPSFIARFLDEARVQAQLQHSGVAQVIDAAVDERTGEPYAVVEHVEGKSLGDVRARAVQIGQRVGWSEGVALATMIAEALAHVHERMDASGRALAIVHRDLSPQNVMVGYGGDIKIIDFGTARGQNRRCHTVAGVVFAKPGYVAPEVANGDSGDARVDLYALGIMLWELCAGKRFLQGEAADHMAAVARNAQNPPAIAKSIGAPEELDGIIAKLTAHDRDARYLASRTAACDLARLLAAAPPLASGERGVRARAAQLMQSLFPAEPGRSRREFAKLVAAARALRSNAPTPVSPAVAAAAAQQEAIEEGMLPGTRYRLRREIGRGASSTVFEAEHVDLGRRVALKVLEASRCSGEFAARFRREAQVLAQLAHENLVELIDFGQASDGRFYCVMELCEGETLEAYLAREKGVDWREALRTVHQALRALEVAHAASLVHRDIKPANLFLTLGGSVKLLDFGLAKGEGEHGEIDAASKMAGLTLFGTPEYMAPEQAASGHVDARADLYALGCVLYEMLTGRIPFAFQSAVAILDAKMKGSPERPRDRAPARGIPESVDDLTMRAIARHPSVRFQTALEMREAVEAVLDAPLKRRNNRRMLGFASLAAMMAFAGVLLVGKARELRAMLPGQRAPIAAVPAAEAAPAAPIAADLAEEPSIDDEPAADAEDDIAPASEQEPEDLALAADPTLAAPPPARVASSHARGARSRAHEPHPSASARARASATPAAPHAPAAADKPAEPAAPPATAVAAAKPPVTEDAPAAAPPETAAPRDPTPPAAPEVGEEKPKAPLAKPNSEPPAKQATKPAPKKGPPGRRKPKSRRAHKE